jgi:hypothetical protein
MLIAVGGPCCPRRVFAEFGFIVAHRHNGVTDGTSGAGARGAGARAGGGAPEYLFLSTSTDLEEAPCYLSR